MAGESEVTAVMNISEKAADILKVFLKWFGSGAWNVAKMPLAAAFNAAKDSISNNELKPGTVPIKDLLENAKLKNDSVITQDGIGRKYMDDINKKAKEYGIPVAFTGHKDSDNISVSVRESDKSIFAQVMKEVIQDKITENPENYASFKVEPWQVESMRDIIKKHDLSAHIVVDKEGEYHFIYEAGEKKAFDIAKNEFKKIHTEVENNLSISMEDGFTVIKDLVNGKEISFDTLLSKTELSETLQENFGYDKIKADMAANKFGETLSAKEQQVFLKDNPYSKFESVEYNIKLENESILLNDISFAKLSMKDGSPEQYVIMNNDGNVVIFSADTNFRNPKELTQDLSEYLGITDKGTVEAVLDKAEKIRDIYYADAELNLSEEINDKERNVGTCGIDRKSKNDFEVKFKDKTHNYSLADKKQAFESIRAKFIMAGVSNSEAAKYAKNVIAKAAKQSTGKLYKADVQAQTQDALNEAKNKVVEETLKNVDVNKGFAIHREVGGTFTVGDEKQTKQYNLGNKNEAVEKMQQDFGISEKRADRIFGKALEQSGIENEKVKNPVSTKSAPKTQQTQKTEIKNTSKRPKP